MLFLEQEKSLKVVREVVFLIISMCYFVSSGVFKSVLPKENFPNVDILPCLDGFSIVLSPCGDIIYISDNVSTFIGLGAVRFVDAKYVMSTNAVGDPSSLD